MSCVVIRACCLFVLMMLLAGQAHGQSAIPQTVYATQFEASEGYSTALTLVGQQNWLGSGSGGNGILTNFFDGLGQAAYVGFFAPVPPDDSLSVFRPIGYEPNPAGQSLVTFSSWMQIVDSQSKPNRDDFRWSVYNSQSQRLFSINFDNETLLVSYALDDGKGFISTGAVFTNDVAYQVEISMNFSRNLWSASVNGLNIVNSKPISTKFNAKLDLGDVDAVWLPQNPSAPGDNYMVFDDYRVSVQALSSIPPTLEAVSRLPDGRFLLRLLGEPGITYSIESSANLADWSFLRTVTASSSGTIDLLDEGAKDVPIRFYRASSVE